MSIGYACLTIGVPGIDYRSCLQKNAAPEVLLSLIDHNLQSLEKAVEYNIRQKIRLFRITSSLIPFGSSPVNSLPWPDLFASSLARIGDKIRRGGLRVSMHPGQYTVLNSPDPAIVSRAVQDLAYHHTVLSSLGLGCEHKIILHIGGVYGDKPRAADRFVSAWKNLDISLRQRLVIENDDKNYSVADVLAIGRQNQIPVVFDNLHHLLNPSLPIRPDYAWILDCRKLWQREDGRQKIHYSQQDPAGKGGAHSKTIGIRSFLADYHGLHGLDVDIMLEVKDKNLSARKCILCTSATPDLKALEHEWSFYKYKVLENSPADYLAIRRLFREGADQLPVAFYDHVEQALAVIPTPGHAENAALHVWGYFKKAATEKEKEIFFGHLERFRQKKASILPVKRYLQKLVQIYQQPYLAASCYFYL